MTRYRDRLPRLDGDVFLTDGGIETTLIFHRGLDLPAFAAFDLLKDADGTSELRAYYEPYLELDRVNRKAIALMEELRDAHAGAGPVVISGCLGPHDDGYQPAELLSAPAAREYHSTQIATFADTAADMVTAITMTYPEEAIGIVRAAREHGLPVVISFTVETDGRLPSGQALDEAIVQVDRETTEGPAYYMINCAHPSHFEQVLTGGEPWVERIRGLRANASTKSHAELDEAEELDEGDPDDLGARHAQLRAKLPRLNVLGGCCGTDHRHVGAICAAWQRGGT